MSLSKEQQSAFDILKTGRSMCITGPAGCGKSYLIKHIHDYCQDHDREIAITAMTGAAGALIGGQTIHKWGGIGLAKYESKMIARNILSKNFQAKKRWNRTEILIIDEVSMMSSELFNKLNNIAKIVRNNHHFFGGLQVIFCGDFAQLEPIGFSKFCFEANDWQKYINQNTVYFNNIIRQNDPTFKKVLMDVRMGQVSEFNKKILRSRLIKQSQLNLTAIKIEGTEECVKPTILYPHKADVEKINRRELQKLIDQGLEARTYTASDTLVDKMTKVPTHVTKAERPIFDKLTNGLPELTLTVGAQVMLVSNLDAENGLVNGSRGVVTKLDANPTVIFDNGCEIEIERVTFEADSGKAYFKRLQIPLILGWALTIHKCQGATLSFVVTDLSKVFCNSQSYVTLSRVRSLDGLFLLGINFKAIKTNPKVVKYYNELMRTSAQTKIIASDN